jgi:hypothetical protein
MMYCPRCGKQQPYDGTRFCPSCGLRMDGVVELLANDGIPAVREVPTQKHETMSPRRHRIRQGAKLMFFSFATVPFLLMLGAAEEDLLALLIVPAIACLLSTIWMLYFRIFGDADVPAPAHPAAIPAAPRPSALPSSPGVPVTGGRQRGEAPEPYRAPGVTERTTDLLNNQ